MAWFPSLTILFANSLNTVHLMYVSFAILWEKFESVCIIQFSLRYFVQTNWLNIFVSHLKTSWSFDYPTTT